MPTEECQNDTNMQSNGSLEQAIREAIAEGSEHSVTEEDAIATQFYIVEVLTASASCKAESGDFELLLRDESYVEGDTVRHKLASSKTAKIISGPHDCPPMPNILALRVWVKENSLTEYLAWSG